MPSTKTIRKICNYCKKIFNAKLSEHKRGRALYCSISCASKATYNFKPLKRENNPNWKGGKIKSNKGYTYILMPEHHRAAKNGYVKLADIILEKKLGYSLNKNEIAHHINEDKSDDSPDNLLPMTISEHTKFHIKKRTNIVIKSYKPNHPNNKRYNWPSDKDLLNMKKSLSLRKIACIIGCNHKTVDARIKKLLKNKTI